MKNLKKTCEKIKAAREIAIGCHINPDGDTIGSLLSLGLGLRKMGKKVHLLSQDGVPKRYRSLPGARGIKRSFRGKVDLAISVDCGTKELLGKVYRTFKRAAYVIEIDHHPVRRAFGDLSLVDPQAPCVGEVIERVLECLGVKIDSDIAENILTSIIVETDSFRMPGLKPSSFELCARLMRKGVDYYSLAETIFWSRTRETLLLTGICLSRCVFEEDGRLVWSVIRRKDFRKMRGKDEDVDAVADEMRAVKRVEVVVLFREKPGGKLRVSLRSKKSVNVAAMAEIYGGGGHYDVAGCVIPDRKETMRHLLSTAASLIRKSK